MEMANDQQRAQFTTCYQACHVSCHVSYANSSFCHASDSVTNANMIIPSVAYSKDYTREIYFSAL